MRGELQVTSCAVQVKLLDAGTSMDGKGVPCCKFSEGLVHPERVTDGNLEQLSNGATWAVTGAGLGGGFIVFIVEVHC